MIGVETRQPVVRGVNSCAGCLEKQLKIDRLEEEVRQLKARLRYRERKEKEGPFGSSTPSSKIPVKENSKEERKKVGGAKPGHPGHGRKSATKESADRVQQIRVCDYCPECGERLQDKGYKERTVIECEPVKVEKILYQLEKKYCPHCQSTTQAQVPRVMPKSLYGNQLVSEIIGGHYLNGETMGRLTDKFGINLGTAIDILHRSAKLFESVVGKLILQYRQAQVRHADETSWRNDGRSGYAWLFASESLSIFLFRLTRASSVVKDILGTEPLPGVLVVDRYGGYNKVPCPLQYCYAHLLREVEDLTKEFPDETEVAAFTSTMIPLLSAAMHLRSQPISDLDYYSQAREIKKKIEEAVNSSAKHLGIIRIQDIFTENSHRLYHWVESRAVPADNNRAERELRPTVIARKISFGSQSDAGARTREILMTVVHTVKKRGKNPLQHLRLVLDSLAADPTLDPFDLLFPEPG